MEMNSDGFYGDMFSGGFGNFNTIKKKSLAYDWMKKADNPDWLLKIGRNTRNNYKKLSLLSLQLNV